MKPGYFITLLFLSSALLLQGQTCFDFANQDADSVTTVVNDNVNYPEGSVFMSDGDIEFIKPDYISPLFQQGDTSFCYIGDVIISVANASDPKTLTMEMVYVEQLIIDGDTIFNNINPPANYSNNNIDFTFNGNNSSGVYEISGDFDTLVIEGQTNCISNVCLEEMNIGSSSYCFDFASQDADSVTTVVNDNVNYPEGSVFMSDGDIEFIKPDYISPLFQQGDTSFCYIGDVIISVANASDPKTLTMEMVYVEQLIIDGDTIFNNINPPANYSNNNIDFTFNGNNSSGVYEISGDFDTLVIEGQTNCISNVCLEETNTGGSSYCFDFASQDADSVTTVVNDNVNYPEGSVFMSDGDIEFIKPDYISPLFQQGDTSFCYMGDVIISVANAPDPKTLSMYMVYVERLIIDGDTIFNSVNPPANYSNNNINFSFNGTNANGVYDISGDFDTLVIESQTNCISDLCLEENGTASLTEYEVLDEFQAKLFPNPFMQGMQLHIEANANIDRLLINDISGKQLINRRTKGQNLSISLDGKLTSGIYIVTILSSDQWVQKKLVVK